MAASKQKDGRSQSLVVVAVAVVAVALYAGQTLSTSSAPVDEEGTKQLLILAGPPGSSSRALAGIFRVHPRVSMGKSLNLRTLDNGGKYLMNITAHFKNNGSWDVLRDVRSVTYHRHKPTDGGMDVAHRSFRHQICQMLASEFDAKGNETHWLLKWGEIRLFLPFFDNLAEDCKEFDLPPLKIKLIHYVRDPRDYRVSYSQFDPEIFKALFPFNELKAAQTAIKEKCLSTPGVGPDSPNYPNAVRALKYSWCYNRIELSVYNYWRTNRPAQYMLQRVEDLAPPTPVKVITKQIEGLLDFAGLPIDRSLLPNMSKVYKELRKCKRSGDPNNIEQLCELIDAFAGESMETFRYTD